MLAAATCLVDVLTGTVLDEFGDPEDDTQVAASAVPCSILESSKRVFREDSDTPRIVTYLVGRVPYGTPVSQGDRLRDTASGQLYLVDAPKHNANPIMTMDVVMDLRRLP